jgi:hypothetical protein
MLAPGLQRMGGQHPPHGGDRAILPHPIGDELTRAFGTIPRGEATPHQIRPLAGPAHDGDRDRWGKNRPWPRGQERLQDRPDAGREHAWPRGGPRSGARQQPAPPRLGRPLLPTRGYSSLGGPGQRHGWWTVATAPAPAALRKTGPCVRKTCGRVPSRSPPTRAVSAGEAIPVRALQVKPICLVVHDQLY